MPYLIVEDKIECDMILESLVELEMPRAKMTEDSVSFSDTERY